MTATTRPVLLPLSGLQRLTTVEDAVAWLKARGAQRLQTDSRLVQPGDAFVAWPGWAQDARQHVPSALAQGAVAVLMDDQGLPDAWTQLTARSDWPEATTPEGVVASLAVCADLKARTGLLADAFMGHPSQSLDVVAVTGTNGKTSSTWWLAQALAALNQPCAVVGTLGLGSPRPQGPTSGFDWSPTGLTTPDPARLHTALRQWVNQGVKACAMEASSIGLVEHRMAGVKVKVAVFTNFTLDHLDHHGTMEAYWAAKAMLLNDTPVDALVLNVDDERGLSLAQQVQAQPDGRMPWTYSLCPDGQVPCAVSLRAELLQETAQGLAWDVVEGAQRESISVPFVGRYNAANLMGVLAALRALGHSLADAVKACEALTAVPGRMETVSPMASHGQSAPPQGPYVVVDYAHTPDALQKALQALRPVANERGGRLQVLVGCGGNRDATKRPLMAAVAEAEADEVWLTSDNPRREDPLAILADMRTGLRQPDRVHVVPDRAQAIAQAVAHCGAADVLLLAGKGHETYQEIDGQRLPFSDQVQAQQAWRQTWGSRT